MDIGTLAVMDDVTPLLGDPLVLWGRWAVAGWLDDNNIRMLNHCIRRLPTADPILEIGAFCGASTIVIARIRQLAGVQSKVISVDPWRFEGADFNSNLGDSKVSFSNYREHVKRTFLSATATFSPDDPPLHFEEYSDDFFVKWEAKRHCVDSRGRDAQLGGAISFAYIDGDHTYHAAKRDFSNVDKHLVSGGFVIFDDSADGTTWGSHQVAIEVLDREDYRLYYKGPNYCFQKI